MRSTRVRLALALITACGSDEATQPAPSVPKEDASIVSPDAATVDAGRDVGPNAVDAAPPPRPFDWVQIISTGQSLSVGASGLPVDVRPQPFQNLMLSDVSPAPAYDNVGDMLSLVPLRSPLRAVAPVSGAYPNNIYGETASEGLANQVSALSIARDGKDYVTIATAVGQGGRKLEYLNKQAGMPYPVKPTTGMGDRLAYWASMYEATHLKELAIAQGKRFGTGAVFLTHGESDAHILAVTTPAAEYEAGLVKLARDYDADLRAITGQSVKIPFFTSQQGTFPVVADAIPTTTNTLWSVSVKYPGEIVCVGPKYQYEYSADHVHLTAPAYERLGEKYAEVYYHTVLQGRRWRPLEPVQVTRSGKEIAVDLYVPYPPLSFDTAVSSAHQSMNNPWRRGKGFEVVTAAGAKLEIESVMIMGNTVKIVLTQLPPAGALTIRHAIVQDLDGPLGGLPEGRHGLLRDSDPFVPRDATTIAVTFTIGSNILTATTPGAFTRVTEHDRIAIAGMTEERIVVAHAGDTLTLSGPVTAPAANAMAAIASDQRNYLVHFEWPLP
jgi:hypothetical protein